MQPLRVAFVGKGGAGKSLIAATVARLLARRGDRVLALDMDTMPGLALSLGVAAGLVGLPEDLAEQREGAGWVMKEDVEAVALVARYAIDGPDGVRLLTLGKLPGHVKPGSTTAFRHVVRTFGEPGWSLVGDLAAGTRQAAFGWAGFARVVALVVEPTATSVLSARRLAKLAPPAEGTLFGVIASKVRAPRDARRIADELGLRLLGAVPYDDQVRHAEQAGRAALDAVPDAPAMNAIREVLGSVGEAA